MKRTHVLTLLTMPLTASTRRGKPYVFAFPLFVGMFVTEAMTEHVLFVTGAG